MFWEKLNDNGKVSHAELRGERFLFKYKILIGVTLYGDSMDNFYFNFHYSLYLLCRFSIMKRYLLKKKIKPADKHARLSSKWCHRHKNPIYRIWFRLMHIKNMIKRHMINSQLITVKPHRLSARRKLSIAGRHSEKNEKLKTIFGLGVGKTMYNLLSARRKLKSLSEAWDSSPTSSRGTTKWLLHDSVNDKIFHKLKWQWLSSPHRQTDSKDQQ